MSTLHIKRGNSHNLLARSLYCLLSILVTSALAAGEVQAQITSCSRISDIHPVTNWNMKPSGGIFKNGDVVGSITAATAFYMPLAHSDTVQILASGNTVSNRYNALPLEGMPGLGLRVLWASYGTTTPLTPLLPPAPYGTVLTNRSWFSVLEARARANYNLMQQYIFELVIIDEALYKGGTLAFTAKNQVQIITSVKIAPNNYQMCLNGFIDPMAALTGTVQVPELPKPVAPTCKFSVGTLNQRVTLGPVDPGQVVPAGVERSQGAEGQAHFLIEATGCNKGATMDIYFTDARNSSLTKNYIHTTNPAVGIRMFYRGEFDPLLVGPAPSGSWVPQRYAPRLGPATVEGGSLSAGFTAQYVRLPNKTEADIRPGPLEAAATFVIVYP